MYPQSDKTKDAMYLPQTLENLLAVETEKKMARKNEPVNEACQRPSSMAVAAQIHTPTAESNATMIRKPRLIWKNSMLSQWILGINNPLSISRLLPAPLADLTSFPVLRTIYACELAIIPDASAFSRNLSQELEEMLFQSQDAEFRRYFHSREIRAYLSLICLFSGKWSVNNRT